MPASKPQPKYDFLTCLSKSEVIKPEVLGPWLAAHSDGEPNELASQLVNDKLLTEWQAKYLLSGRYRLHLGNYELLERIQRDQFGDRFIALHPNLGRTVHVQVLPAELTNDDAQREAFLSQAGQAGELDHPNLAHVFDIDRQQGRYYLVTEQVHGIPATELPAGMLDAPRLGTIIRDAIAGLQYAHARGVTHGAISASNVVVDEEGGVKVTQLALAPLFDSDDSGIESDDSLAPEQRDLTAIVEIGRQCLKKLPRHDDRSRRKIREHFRDLSSNEPEEFTAAVERLSTWVEEQRALAAPAEAEMQPVITKKPAIFAAKRTEPAAGPEPKVSYSRQLIGACLLSVIVGGIAVAYVMSRPRPVPRSEQAIKELDNFYTPKASAKQLAPQPKKPSDAPKFNTPPRKPGKIVEQQTKPSQPTVASPKAPTDNGDSLAATPIAKTPPAAKPTNNATPKPPNATQGTRSTPPTQAKPTGDSAADAAAATKAKQSTAKKKPVKPTKAVGPFDDFPASIDLPSTESTETVAVLTLGPRSNHLLGLEAIAPEGVGKGRTTFGLQRSESDKQTWDVAAKRSAKAKGDVVAQFQFLPDSNELQFRWLDDADRSKLANYFRNCAIKVTIANSSRIVSLRTPLKLPDFKLTRDRTFVQLKSAVEHFPQPEMITVQLLPWKASGLPKTWLEPAIVGPGMPAVVQFHEAKRDRFFWLQVECDIRKKLSLQMQLLLKHAEGSITPITHADQLPLLARRLQEAQLQTQQAYEANKDVVAPEGKKTKWREYVAKLKSVMTTTRAQAKAANENVTLMETVYDRPIPLQIVFKAEQLTVVLADTRPPAAKTEKSDKGDKK